MFEVTTEAIVLHKEDAREQDQRVYLYTRALGKVIAKATSSRKIVSKLAAHVEPLNLATVKLVSKNDGAEGRNLQLIDALSIDSASCLKKDPQRLIQAVKVCELIRKSIPVGVPDEDLWDLLQALRSGAGTVTLHRALHALGFNAQFARCQLCDRTQPEYFAPGENFFICTACTFNAQWHDAGFIKVVT